MGCACAPAELVGHGAAAVHQDAGAHDALLAQVLPMLDEASQRCQPHACMQLRIGMLHMQMCLHLQRQ